MQANNSDRRGLRRDANSGPDHGLVASSSGQGNHQNKGSQSQVPDSLLSQEALQHYAEDTAKEAILERKRLDQNAQERRQFASSIIRDGNENSSRAEANAPFEHNALTSIKSTKKNFGKITDGSSKKDRLQDLLEKTEQYTKFILQQTVKSHRNNLRRKELGDLVAAGGNEGMQTKNGKASLSKRRLNKKGAKGAVDSNQAGSSDEEAEEPTLTRLTAQPSILAGEHNLKDYQLDSLNWLISLYETGINGILADEMGLGKTVQTISLLAFLREFKQINGYHLIIMPKSVVGNWMAEFRKWLPMAKVVNLIARKEQREDIIKNQIEPGNFDICITTFEGVRKCMAALLKFNWEYIVIDEAHKIKNEDSQTSKRIRQFNSKYRLLLTGTPLQNNLHELWSLLNFLLPEIFSSSDDFDEWFDLGGKDQSHLTDAEKEKKNDEMIKQLHKILRPFMLRRIKREVEKSLLPKIEMHINVGITETQKSIYRQLLKKSTIEKGTSATHYKNILVQLRKVCNHPYLFQGVEPDDAPELGDHLIKVAGKLQFLDKLLKKCKEDKSQTLIFSGFTSMLDILEDYCRFRDYKYCRLDGNTELDDRQSQIDDFTSKDTDKFIFLISTRAGGLGLNLMTANTVVLYDSDWNPQMDLQAMDRAHRIGQKKQVRVYRLITKNTMEEKMVEKQTMKLKLDSLIIQKGRMAPKNTGLQKDDLKDMVNYGADAIFEIGSNIDDEDIEEMIKNGEERAKTLQQETEKVMKEKFDMINFEMNSCNLYQFEDVDYLKEKRKDAEDLLKKNVIALLDAETNMTSRRKVTKNMAENNLCPNIFGNGNIGVSNEAKKKKLSKVQDFRFFPDPERLKELIQLELESKYSGYIQGVDLPIFTPEMKIEKDMIESKGFPDWDRREFQKFIQALELYATDDYKSIAQHMDFSKSVEEVEKYARVFFAKVHTLHDKVKIMSKIEKAQKNVSFNMRAPKIIKEKVRQYSNPMEEMLLTQATQKSKFFCKESDVILICLTEKYGYGNWVEIKKALKREQRCRFDHLLISRNEEEIKKRVVYLVQSLEKEEQEPMIEEKPVKKSTDDKYANLTQTERDEEMMRLIKQAEEQAAIAFTGLSLQRGEEAEQAEAANNNGQSQNTQEEKENSLAGDSPKKNEEPSQNSMDKEMAEAEMVRDYDRAESEKPKPKKGKKKPAKKAKKEEEDIYSADSGIRLGQGQRTIDAEMEEEEVLKNEFNMGSSIRDDEIQASSQVESGQKIDSNGNTTADTINENIRGGSEKKSNSQMASKSSKPRQKTAMANGGSTKSTKQSNIADWVNSATKPLVGQKRKGDALSGRSNGTKKQQISEFDVRDKK